jgi:TrmH family RNA methyltransferase
MSGKDNPQAILAPTASRTRRWRRSPQCFAPLDRRPGTATPAISAPSEDRRCNAAGELILIDDSADPHSVEAVRASMEPFSPQAVATARWEEFVPWLRSGPGQLVGTSLNTTNDYLDAKYEQPCFLLIGNESQGMPASYEAECDLLVKMPMLGRADSLNAAVAAAVMAFQLRASWRNP